MIPPCRAGPVHDERALYASNVTTGLMWLIRHRFAWSTKVSGAPARSQAARHTPNEPGRPNRLYGARLPEERRYW